MDLGSVHNTKPQEVSAPPQKLLRPLTTTKVSSVASGSLYSFGSAAAAAAAAEAMFPTSHDGDDVEERRYKDHSNDPPVNNGADQQQHSATSATSSASSSMSTTANTTTPFNPLMMMKTVVHFPSQLHIMLQRAEIDNYSDIVSWQAHGRAFMVRDREHFVTKVMPLYFRQTKFSSFQRQLNLYGYIRMSKKGQDYGGYYHELFLRSRPDLCQLMGRVKSLDASGKLLRDEPNFYAMDPVGVTPGTGGGTTTTGDTTGGSGSASHTTGTARASPTGQGTTTLTATSTSAVQQHSQALSMMRTFPLHEQQLPQQQQQMTAQAPMQIFQQGGANLEAIFSEMFPPSAPSFQAPEQATPAGRPLALSSPISSTTTSGNLVPRRQQQQIIQPRQMLPSTNVHTTISSNNSGNVGTASCQGPGAATVSQAVEFNNTGNAVAAHGSTLAPNPYPQTAAISQQQQQQQGLPAVMASPQVLSLNVNLSTLRMLSGGATGVAPDVTGNITSTNFSSWTAPVHSQLISQPSAVAEAATGDAETTTPFQDSPKRRRLGGTTIAATTSTQGKEQQQEDNEEGKLRAPAQAAATTATTMPPHPAHFGLDDEHHTSSINMEHHHHHHHDVTKMRQFLDDVDFESGDEEHRGARDGGGD